MASAINALERELIDEALKAGKVTKVPTGKSIHSESYNYIWSDALNKLVNTVPAKNVPGTKEFTKRRVRERRVEVLRMRETGLTVFEIAKKLKVSKYTIENDLRVKKE